VTVNVAAIIRSTEAQDQNVAYVELPFLQQAAAQAITRRRDAVCGARERS
jgi:hypothetical protein